MEGRICSPEFAVPQNQQNTPMPTSEGPQTPAFSASKAEKIAAWLSYPIAYFYVAGYVLGEGSFHRNLLIFTLIFWLAVEAFCRAMGSPKANAESRLWVGCMFLLAMSLMLWNGTTVLFWNGFFLHFTAAYWVLCRTGCLAERETGPMFPLDALNAVVIFPFGGFFLRAHTVWHSIRDGRKIKKPGGLLALLVVIPLLLFAVQQLAMADAGFYALVQSLADAIPRMFSHLGSFPFQLLLSLPVGAYLYGLIAKALRAQGHPVAQSQAQKIRASAEDFRKASPRTIGLSGTAFCLLYLVFFTVQAGTLLAALRGTLPGNFTASQYAREGFWQLCRVMVLNVGLLAAGAKLCRVPLRQHRGLKTLALLLDASNLLFVVVALCKMGVYISRYGLTPSRVLATWFIVVLAVVTVLIAVTIFRPFRAVRAAILTGAILFALLCIGNPDGLIIRTNLRLYQAGVTEELDTGVLRICGAADDVQEYARMLHKADWYRGHTLDEIRWELGEPGAIIENTALWNAGWNIIDPEMVEVVFDTSPERVAVESRLCEGMAGPDIQ